MIAALRCHRLGVGSFGTVLRVFTLLADCGSALSGTGNRFRISPAESGEAWSRREAEVERWRFTGRISAGRRNQHSGRDAPPMQSGLAYSFAPAMRETAHGTRCRRSPRRVKRRGVGVYGDRGIEGLKCQRAESSELRGRHIVRPICTIRKNECQNIHLTFSGKLRVVREFEGREVEEAVCGEDVMG